METNKIVEALILGGVLVVSLGSQTAAAQVDACAEGAPKKVTAGTNFIQQEFTPKCSAGVTVSVNDSSTIAAGVHGMSKKGMHSFGGDVVGGSVKACETSSVADKAPAASATGCPAAAGS